MPLKTVEFASPIGCDSTSDAIRAQAALDAQDDIFMYAYIGSVHRDLGLPRGLKQKLLKSGMAGVAKRPWDEHREFAFLVDPAWTSRGRSATRRVDR